MLSPALGSAQRLSVLRACSVQQQGGLLRLRLELSTQLAYRSFSLSDPDRLVVDLPGVSSQPLRIDPVPAGAAVARIRSAPHLDGLRVVLDLQQPCPVNPHWEGSTLVLEFAARPGSVALSASEAAAVAAPIEQAEQGRLTDRACIPMWWRSTPATAGRIRVR